jgi:uncharacterized protein
MEDDVSKTPERPEGGAASTDGPTAGSEAEEGTPPKRRIINQPEPEPLDLGEVSREAVLKRTIPVVAGVGVLVLVVWLLRRRT